MLKIFDFIATVNPDIFIAVVLAILFTLEQFFANTLPFSKRAKHLGTNVLLQIGYTILNYGLAFIAVKCITWTESKHIGLFSLIRIPLVIKISVGIFCIDLVNYWAHRLYHTLEIFWRLHRVHHSDTELDTSTAYRFHPFDSLLDNIAGILATVLFGLEPTSLIIWFIIIFQS